MSAPATRVALLLGSLVLFCSTLASALALQWLGATAGLPPEGWLRGLPAGVVGSGFVGLSVGLCYLTARWLVRQVGADPGELRTLAERVAKDDLELEQKASALERAGRYKSEFLANMSHELRTPLNSLLLLSHTLERNDEQNLTDEQIRTLRTIHEAGRSLQELIDDVLDLSKVEAGKVEIERCDVSLRELLPRIVAQFEPSAGQRELELGIEWGVDAPERIATDPRRFGQILENLLSNAIKFTHHGSVRLRVAHDSRTDMEWLAVAVTDTGIGIPNESQQIVFEAFRQQDGSTSRRYGGTGLGLSISSQLARTLGGEIDLESEPGRGSTFTVRLPLDSRRKRIESEPPARISSPTLSSSAHVLRGRRLLIVEDDLRSSFALSKLLRGLGIEVLLAENGEACLRQLEDDSDVDLILMDVMMPVMDGYETTRRIRAQERFKELPILAVTAKATPEDRAICLEAGASDYLIKPIDVEKLVNLLRIWLLERS